jgi:hypothetical protein
MSPNLSLAAISIPAIQSVSDFVSAYNTTDKTIADLTSKFVGAADEAKKKQDDIVPHLAYMQSLLSKKGTNHHLVTEARKQGNRIPWWTDYYKTHKDRLWESLRTMERRIDAYRRDPSIPLIKPENEGRVIPKHLTQLEHKLLGVAVNAREVIVDLRAGRVDEAIAKLDKHTPTQDRIDEHLERGLRPTLANPDGDAKLRSDVREFTTTAADELKTALAAEPDRDIANRMLTDYLRTVAEQFSDERITIKNVNATVEFAGRGHRIMPGDFLERRDKDLPPTLCKCVGVADYMKRRKIQDWNGGYWGKERIVFSQYEPAYRVISQSAARRFAPGAFSARTISEGL